MFKKYIDKGYTAGRCNLTEEQKLSYQKIYTDRVYINNGKEDKYIHAKDLQMYLNNDWTQGRLLTVYTKERGNSISASKKGKIRMDGPNNIIKYISQEKQEEYEKLGYIRHPRK